MAKIELWTCCDCGVDTRAEGTRHTFTDAQGDIHARCTACHEDLGALLTSGSTVEAASAGVARLRAVEEELKTLRVAHAALHKVHDRLRRKVERVAPSLLE